jgi:hypothetical protein
MRLKQDQINEIIKMKNDNISNNDIIDKFKISKATFFRIVKNIEKPTGFSSCTSGACKNINKNLNNIELNDVVVSNSNNISKISNDDLNACKLYSNAELLKLLVINNKYDIKNLLKQLINYIDTIDN